MSDDELLVPAISPRLAFYERALAAAFADENPDNTLFVQLTQRDMATVTVAFYCMSLFYGNEIVDPARDKFIELMEAQGFRYRPTGEVT